MKNILNAALEGEIDIHLDEQERISGNRFRHTPKQVQTPLGKVTVHTPRDWESTLEPKFIKK